MPLRAIRVFSRRSAIRTLNSRPATPPVITGNGARQERRVGQLPAAGGHASGYNCCRRAALDMAVRSETLGIQLRSIPVTAVAVLCGNLGACSRGLSRAVAHLAVYENHVPLDGSIAGHSFAT